MGSYHGAEICELVGLCFLYDLTEDKKISKTNCGLYCDDGYYPKIIDQLRKSIMKSFQKHNLKVNTELSNQIVDSLDITLDLEKNEYLLFRKENAKNIYMNFNSNHSYLIKREIPLMIQKRLSSLSKTEEIFEKIKILYEKALKNSGFKTPLIYVQDNFKESVKQRLR